jgi:REP element-mobilizing transposase RayT
VRPGIPHSRDLRKARFSEAGNYYLLTATAAQRRPLLTVPDHAAIVLDALRWLHDIKRFDVHAAVVMPDHFHVVGALTDLALAAIMHSLKSFTAHRLVEIGFQPPVWQSGYHDRALRDEDDYITSIRYVVENPVRAGLVSRADQYPHLILPPWWVKEP